MLLSTLEIRDFTALLAKTQRMESAIQERNKVRDRERNRRRASGAVLNTGFKKPRDVRLYSTTPIRESQAFGFHRD